MLSNRSVQSPPKEIQDLSAVCRELVENVSPDSSPAIIELADCDLTVPPRSESVDSQRVDRAALIKNLEPEYAAIRKEVSDNIERVRSSFSGSEENLRLSLLESEKLYAKLLVLDRSAESRLGSWYCGSYGVVESPGDMQRYIGYTLRQELICALFDHYCESYNPAYNLQQRELGDSLSRLFVSETLESEGLSILGKRGFLERVAIAELTLSSFRVMCARGDSGDSFDRAKSRLTHNVFWHAYEGCSGVLALSNALREGRHLKQLIRERPGLQALFEHCYDEYITDSDAGEISTFRFFILSGNICARAYRNACIEAVEAIEEIDATRFSRLGIKSRIKLDGSLMKFSDFINQARKRSLNLSN